MVRRLFLLFVTAALVGAVAFVTARGSLPPEAADRSPAGMPAALNGQVPSPLLTPAPTLPAADVAPLALPLEVHPWVDADAAVGDTGYALATPEPSPTPVPLPTLDLTLSPVLASRAAAPLVAHGPRTGPVIAITIDDTYTRSVLAAEWAFLVQERINATWFPVGLTIAGNADLWRQISDAGFPIADHTWSHPDLTKLTEAQIETEILRQAGAVKAATGRLAAPFLRPPGGAWNGNVLVAAGRTGQAAVVLWDTTSGDTGRGPVSEIVANAIQGQNGTILLFHANDPRPQEAIPQVVAWYRERGYEFVTVGQLLGVPGPVPFPPGPPAPTPSPTPTPAPTPELP